MFKTIANAHRLKDTWLRRLREDGFIVVPGPFEPEAWLRLTSAYDQAMEAASAADRKVGSTTVRVHDFATRDLGFEPIYIFSPLLACCCDIVGRPFKLSSMLGRTLLPRKSAQPLHVDCPRDVPAWPMAGFIFMIDEFRKDNGATCFVPGSHKPASSIEANEIVQACGQAGSMIIYNGSVQHGHGANLTSLARRSIQGAFIPREAPGAIDFASRMQPDAIASIGPLAAYLLGFNTLEDHCEVREAQAQW